jgi:predicted  nucleic acid-binding Zn-ribbon protein
MENPVSRGELYASIDRQNAHLEKVMTAGFDAIKQRLDVANGRTSKLEERMGKTEQYVAVLEDRAKQSEGKATEAENKAVKSKWQASAAASAIIAAIEGIKALVGHLQ